MLKSKIHRVTVTEANLDYEGSLTLDSGLMEKANMMPFERIMIYNISNGERFDTYLIPGKRGSGTVCLNGGAARRGTPGDLIIIASYAMYSDDEIQKGKSVVVTVDKQNRFLKRFEKPWLP